MKNTFVQIGLTALLVGGAVLLPQVTNAYRGDPAVKGPNYTEERHELMEQAFENGDFTTWKSLMTGRGRVTRVITPANFKEFAAAHELAEEGKLDEAQAIREKLGLGTRSGNGRGMGQGCNWQ